MKVASGILPIAEDTGKICLAWRSPHVADGDRWGVIGGMCPVGTSPEDSAVIELIEEVGYIGPIRLHKAFVCHRRGFTYHNYIGIVPTAFSFAPDEMYTWETSFIDWFTVAEIDAMLQNKSSKFHKGLVQLWRESKSLIEEKSYENHTRKQDGRIQETFDRCVTKDRACV
jgi:8-oxo-dGTP pyrophosphatase MutT (NUDIX family)